MSLLIWSLTGHSGSQSMCADDPTLSYTIYNSVYWSIKKIIICPVVVCVVAASSRLSELIFTGRVRRGFTVTSVCCSSAAPVCLGLVALILPVPLTPSVLEGSGVSGCLVWLYFHQLGTSSDSCLVQTSSIMTCFTVSWRSEVVSGPLDSTEIHWKLSGTENICCEVFILAR